MAGNHMSQLSPRQRMINMMYLVLTALLALNISKEVLEAFQKMDKDIEYSYGEKYEMNKRHYADFELRAKNNPEKLAKWNEYAKELRRETQQMISVLGETRDKIVELADGVDKNGMLKKKDDKELIIKLLTKNEGERGDLGYGRKLKEARREYKAFLLSLDTLGIYEGEDSIVKYDIIEILKTDDVDDDGPDGPKEPKSWEKDLYYQHVPQAVMAFMAQDKLNVGNIEGSILELLQKKTGQSSITVNSQRSVVKYPKQTIMLELVKMTLWMRSPLRLEQLAGKSDLYTLWHKQYIIHLFGIIQNIKKRAPLL